MTYRFHMTVPRVSPLDPEVLGDKLRTPFPPAGTELTVILRERVSPAELGHHRGKVVGIIRWCHSHHSFCCSETLTDSVIDHRPMVC